MAIDETRLREAVTAALAAREWAYAPYSGYRVGAAVVADDGTVFPGVNVENASYGATLCAERVALGTMVAAGRRVLLAVAVATEDGATPCGLCRQVLTEFAPTSSDVVIVCVDRAGTERRFSLRALLPEAFSFPGPKP